MLLIIYKNQIMKKKAYLSPEVEVIEVAVEQGFAASSPNGSPDFGNGFGSGGRYNQDWG